MIRAAPIRSSLDRETVTNNQWTVEHAWADAVDAAYEGFLCVSLRAALETHALAGRYSEVHLGLKFRRKHRYYVAEALFPALFFLAIAWSGFWVERESAPARVSIAVIPVLIMRTLLNGVYANLQIISYSIFLTSLLHLGESLAVISVFEYALVSWVLGHERERLAEHRLYIALRVPILHYVQMSDAAPPADDAPGPRAAVVAAVDRLRDRFARRPRPPSLPLGTNVPRSGTRATTAASTARAWPSSSASPSAATRARPTSSS